MSPGPPGPTGGGSPAHSAAGLRDASRCRVGVRAQGKGGPQKRKMEAPLWACQVRAARAAQASGWQHSDRGPGCRGWKVCKRPGRGRTGREPRTSGARLGRRRCRAGRPSELREERGSAAATAAPRGGGTPANARPAGHGSRSHPDSPNGAPEARGDRRPANSHSARRPRAASCSSPPRPATSSPGPPVSDVTRRPECSMRCVALC